MGSKQRRAIVTKYAPGFGALPKGDAAMGMAYKRYLDAGGRWMSYDIYAHIERDGWDAIMRRVSAMPDLPHYDPVAHRSTKLTTREYARNLSDQELRAAEAFHRRSLFDGRTVVVGTPLRNRTLKYVVAELQREKRKRGMRLVKANLLDK